MKPSNLLVTFATLALTLGVSFSTASQAQQADKLQNHVPVPPVCALAANNADTQAICLQLQRYEKALNASETEAVMKLYTADAVFMPQHSSPAVGQDAVRSAYDRVFKAIKLDIKFAIDEVEPVSSSWAYVRTRSSGTVKVLGTQLPPLAEANQELFLLRKEPDSQWRIARYIFSTTNPPAQR